MKVQALVVGLVLGGMMAPKVALAESSKFAYVDLQRALEQTEDGKKAKAKLKADFDQKQKELDQEQDDLKKMKDDLDKKAQLMKPEALAKQQQTFQNRFAQLQQTYMRLQRDLASKEQEATRGIFTKLQVVVGTIAQRDHFAMVLEKNSAVVWGDPALDITNEVIRMYNTQAGHSASSKKSAKRK